MGRPSRGQLPGGLCSHSPSEFERLKSAAVPRLLLDGSADVHRGASSRSTDGDDTRRADVAGIARRRASEVDPGQADANRQRAARRQVERRATRRQLQGALPLWVVRSRGRTNAPRRGKDEEPQMSMEREREHLAQVDRP